MHVLLLYAAGHLVVAALLLLVVRFFRRDPNLESRRQGILELRDRRARIEAFEAEIIRVEGEMSIIQREIDRLRAMIAESVVVHVSRFAAAGYYALAVVLIELEAGLCFLLSASASFLGWSPAVWAFSAVPVSVAWVLVAHVVLSALVTDEDRPRRTLRNARRWTVITGIGVVMGIFTTMAGRAFADADTIERIAGAGIAALTFLVSLAAAFSAITAEAIRENSAPERDLAKAENSLRQFSRHREIIDANLKQLRSGGGPVQGGPAIAAALMIAMLLLSGIGRAATPAQAAAPAARAAFNKEGICEVVLDVSMSDNAAVLDAVKANPDLATRVVEAFGCSVLRLTTFGAGLASHIDEFAIPPIADLPGVTCGKNAQPGHKMAIQKLYPGLRSEEERKVAEACFTAARDARAAVLKKAGERLMTLAATPPQGPCTALPQAVQRVLVRSQHVAVLSDGVANCKRPTMSVPVGHTDSLLFLVVPGHTGTVSGAADLLDQLALIEKRFPGSRAILAGEATPSFWRHLSAK